MVVQTAQWQYMNQVLKHALFKKTFASQKKKFYGKTIRYTQTKIASIFGKMKVTEIISLKASNRHMI